MKTSKKLFALVIIFILMGCTNQQSPVVQSNTPALPTTITSTSTTPFLDFDHPRLHEIAGDKPLIIHEIVRNHSRDDEDIKYAAIILETGDPIFEKKMLLFKINKSNSILLYESEAYVYLSFNIMAEDPHWLIDNSNFYYMRSVMGGIYQFGSSYLEVPFRASNGGNCYDCGEMKVIGITEDGIAKDITPAFNFTSKTYIDTRKNLQFKIIATRYYEFDYGACDHVSSPFAFRLFAWDGEAYVDVSENEKDFYDQKNVELITDLQKNWGDPLHACWVMPTLATIFFNYESSGRVEYGWEQIKSLGDLSHWDVKNTPPEEIQSYHEVFDMLEQRKNEGQATSTP